MKILIRRFLFVSAITLLVGCGGGSGTTEKYVLILHNSPAGICESQALLNALHDKGFKGVSTSEHDTGTMDCGDYPNAKECKEDSYTDDLAGLSPVDCVIQFTGLEQQAMRSSSKKASSPSKHISSTIKNVLSNTLK